MVVVPRAFEKCRMLTLTVNPENYGNDPVRAWDELIGGRGVNKFLNAIGISTYVVVVEVHPKRPEWFHLHVLCDAAGGWRDYSADIKEGKELGWGRVTWSRDYGREWQGAVHYLCGYVSKKSDHIRPAWLVSHRGCSRQFRVCWASRDVGRLVSAVDRRGQVAIGESKSRSDHGEWCYDETEQRWFKWKGRVPLGVDADGEEYFDAVPDFDADVEADEKRGPKRSPCRRFAECGQSCNVGVRVEGKVRMLGRVKLSCDQVLSILRELGATEEAKRAGLEVDTFVDEDGRESAWVDLPSGSVDWLLEKLRGFESQVDYFTRVRRRMRLLKLGRRFSVARTSAVA